MKRFNVTVFLLAMIAALVGYLLAGCGEIIYFTDAASEDATRIDALDIDAPTDAPSVDAPTDAALPDGMQWPSCAGWGCSEPVCNETMCFCLHSFDPPACMLTPGCSCEFCDPEQSICPIPCEICP